MTTALNVRNVNYALPRAMALLRDQGRPIAPRGKLTAEVPGVVTTTYAKPREMVLADPARDANPFFHLFESLWILAGRNDVKFLAHFLPRMADFSDDGVTFYAPYGQRLRTTYGFDQIELAVKALRDDLNSRQVVLSIWDPCTDLGARSKDIPCNDMVMLKVRDGALRMTVCNRSNDVVLGAYGANVVQFSTLLVYLAGRVGVDVGTYTQVSDSFHVYEDNPFWLRWKSENPHPGQATLPYDPYVNEWKTVASDPAYLMPDELASGAFDRDLKMFFDIWDARGSAGVETYWLGGQFETMSFMGTVGPMLSAFEAWKSGAKARAVDLTVNIGGVDWGGAAAAWMERRLKKAGEAA